MKWLMVQPGASWCTADVYEGLMYGLSRVDPDLFLTRYNLDVRIARSSQWLAWNWQKSGKRGTAPTDADKLYHAASGVLERALRLEVDWVVVVSAMYFPADMLVLLRRAGFKIAMLFTECPYDDQAHRKIAPLADVCFVNDKTSVAHLADLLPTYYLAHAYHPERHQVQPDNADLEWDVSFVGTVFPERYEFFKSVNWHDMSFAIFGNTDWIPARSRMRTFVRGGVMDNMEAVSEVYRRTRVNLNLHRSREGLMIDGVQQPLTEAYSLNPRAFELAACGLLYLNDTTRQELWDIFGDLVPTFTTADELRERILEWRGDPVRRRQRGLELAEAVRPHSWVTRAQQVYDTLVTFGRMPVTTPSLVSTGG